MKFISLSFFMLMMMATFSMGKVQACLLDDLVDEVEELDTEDWEFCLECIEPGSLPLLYQAVRERFASLFSGRLFPKDNLAASDKDDDQPYRARKPRRKPGA